MRRIPFACGLVLLGSWLLLSSGARADYWVAVGSYLDPAVADRARQRASGLLNESFSISRVETGGNLFNRVVAGPYLSREIADHLLGEAQRGGFETAWILTTERTDLTEYGRSEYDPAPLEFAPAATRPDPAPADIPGFNVPERQSESKERQLIEQAPDDYTLHKLNRDQATIDWSSPYLLAANDGVLLAAALAAQAESPVASPLDTSPSGLESPSLKGPPLELEVPAGEPLILRSWRHSEAGIRIDGRLDEQPWQEARSIRTLKVTEPDTLEDPAYGTQIRLFYTERGIYVSFDMEQPAETLVRRLSSRDNREVKRDYVSFTLDTSGNARYAYWMTLALGDTQMDGTALPERQFTSNWDGAWWGASRETERGWAAEFFVPWSQMTMPQLDAEGRRRIGFYSSRLVAHLDQRWAFPALPRSQPRFMSAFQQIEVRDVAPRQQWSLFPYASGTSDALTNETSAKAGMDLFWRPATNTQLTATVNPDFGTVEADEVIVNLTAFETFFPEKRLFFLEGREIFETSIRSQGFDPVVLLNTRRIGQQPRVPIDAEDEDFAIGETNQPSELYGAGKVTGQAGAVRYGLLTAFEQDTTLVAENGEKVEAAGRDYAVARMLYEDNRDGAYRALGAMATLTAHPEENATAAGVDYHYLSRTGAWKWDGQFLYSDLDLEGAGGGGFVDLEYTPRMGMKYKAEFTYYDKKLDINDLGFLRRNDKMGGRIGSEWIKSGLESIRNFKIETFLRYEENLDGLAIRSGVGGEGEFTLNNLHSVEVGLRYFPARYDDRNSFGNGTYRISERPSVQLGYKTDNSLALSGFLFTAWEGDGIDGQRLEAKAGLNWRPVDRLNFEVSTSYQVRDGWLLHQEDRNMTAFDAEEWQPELKMDFFLNARQELRMKLQWVGIKAFEDRFYLIPESPGDLIEIGKPDQEPDDFNVSALNFQVRYRWQIAPLSDVFVVYTKNGLDDTPEANFGELFENAWNDPVGEQLVVKVRYRLGS